MLIRFGTGELTDYRLSILPTTGNILRGVCAPPHPSSGKGVAGAKPGAARMNYIFAGVERDLAEPCVGPR
jgi:hypothetical protein